VASRFPSSTFVDVHNMTHVSAIRDFDRCASRIVLEFIRHRSAGDTSCAADYNEIRLVPSFPHTAASATPAPQGSRVRSSVADRRLVDVVTWTAGDLVPRWLTMYGSSGVGLRGGTFTTTGSERVRFAMHRLRFTEDVAVSGTMTWNRRGGSVRAAVRFTGPEGVTGRLVLTWNDWQHHAVAHSRGEIAGRPVDLRLPAP
jgi:hypothetical protein